MQTRQTRDRNGYVHTRKGQPKYRRVIPPELRARFGGKSEFIRSLNVMSKAEAEAEFERIAQGRPAKVQPVAKDAWPQDFDLSYLRYLAETGGDVAGRADELQELSTRLRSRVALGVTTEGEDVAAHLERLAKRARGEKVGPVVKLKDAAERFLATVKVEGTLSQYRPRLNDIVEALGAEKDIRTITATDCRRFAQETVHAIPSNRRKKWPNLSLAKAIKQAERDNAPTQSPETKRGYVTLLKNFLGWCEQEDLIDTNPAAKVPRPKGQRGTREDFSANDLKTIFAAAPYKPAERDMPGWFWAFPIALFSGMRRDEIVLLRKGDVKHDRDVHYFDLREDAAAGRTLKTPTSIRRVPVHPTLIRMGFLKHVASVTDGGWLFPDLMEAKRPGDAFGKRFARHLDKLGITDAGLTFHSTRHTFQTAGRESGIEKRYSDRLGGWSTGGVSESYGKYDLKTLARELAKLNYEVGLKHLYLVKPRGA